MADTGSLLLTSSRLFCLGGASEKSTDFWPFLLGSFSPIVHHLHNITQAGLVEASQVGLGSVYDCNGHGPHGPESGKGYWES